jgi:hypothetical protein
MSNAKSQTRQFKVCRLGPGYTVFCPITDIPLVYFADKAHKWAARQQAQAVVKRLNGVMKERRKGVGA